MILSDLTLSATSWILISGRQLPSEERLLEVDPRSWHTADTATKLIRKPVLRHETFWCGSHRNDIYFLVTSYITYAPMMQLWWKTDFWFSFKREVNDRFLNVPPRVRLNENDKTLAAWDVPSFHEFLALLIILYNKQNTNNISASGSRCVCGWVDGWMNVHVCLVILLSAILEQQT